MWEGIVGTIVGGLGSYFLVRLQVNEARKIAKAELLLQFDQQLAQYSEVHKALRPGGAWSKGIPDGAQWADVDSYMGLFERLLVLIDNGIVDKDLAERFYGYRLQNIVANADIRRAKLRDEAQYWVDFAQLCEKLGISIPT